MWKFGHDVDTDVMAPWGVIARPFQERRAAVLAIRAEFAREVRPGDVVVAGRNWGCGSSREQAAENLQLLGVTAVVAESFGRIYFRNAIARAFPNVVCPGAWDATEDGDEVEVDLRGATVTNHSRGWVLEAQPYTADMLAIVEAGGLLAVLRQRVHDGRVGHMPSSGPRHEAQGHPVGAVGPVQDPPSVPVATRGRAGGPHAPGAGGGFGTAVHGSAVQL